MVNMGNNGNIAQFLGHINVSYFGVISGPRRIPTANTQ